jgi:aminocarboxymuconate-semialdehyde decarboxylase
MMIDVYNHFMPPAYFAKLVGLIPGHPVLGAFPRLPTLMDIDARLRLLDEFDGLQQVLSLANPALELVGPPEVTPALAQMANDALAELCRAHPDRFPAFVAALPMNNLDATLAEIDRAVGTLGARGVQMFTNVAGEPLSAAKFRPVFARMAALDLPVWVHPIRGAQFSDYTSESASLDEIWFTFGWPYETTACMARLIYCGLFDELPGLKIITHHMGGMIPYFAGRINLGFRQIFFGTPEENPVARERGLKRHPLAYFKGLYADTALNGDAAATRCGHAFFGTGACLFATDAPFDAAQGRTLIAGTLRAVAALDISAAERERILAGNARALLRL